MKYLVLTTIVLLLVIPVVTSQAVDIGAGTVDAEKGILTIISPEYKDFKIGNDINIISHIINESKEVCSEVCTQVDPKCVPKTEPPDCDPVKDPKCIILEPCETKCETVCSEQQVYKTANVSLNPRTWLGLDISDSVERSSYFGVTDLGLTYAYKEDLSLFGTKLTLKDGLIKTITDQQSDPTVIPTQVCFGEDNAQREIGECDDWNFETLSCNGEGIDTGLKTDNTGCFYPEHFSAYFIYATAAEHLNSSRIFISDIWASVKEQDDNWSETIPDGDFVRVTFEKNLTYWNDITVYARNNTPDSKIEIYNKDGVDLLATIDIPSEGSYSHKLDGLGENVSDTFDLKSIGDIEYDYIVDPTYSACKQEQANQSTAGDGNCGLNYNGNYSVTSPDPINFNWADANWSTASQLSGITYYNVTYVSPTNVSNGTFFEVSAYHSFNAFDAYCYNYTKSGYSIFSSPNGGASVNVTIPSQCLGSQVILSFRSEEGDSTTSFYEERMWWNSTITATAPSVVMLSPDNGFNNITIPASTSFTCNATAADNPLTNITLWITNSSTGAFVINQTSTVTGTTNLSSWNVSLGSGDYVWNCQVCDSGNSCTFATNKTIWIGTTITNCTRNLTSSNTVYTIGNNFVNSQYTTCIYISNNNITLDGNGKYISTPGLLDRNYIVLSLSDNATIRNMNLTPGVSGYAIGLTGAVGNYVYNNTVGKPTQTAPNSNTGMELISANYSQIINNTVNWQDVAVKLTSSSYNNFTGNNFTSQNSSGEYFGIWFIDNSNNYNRFLSNIISCSKSEQCLKLNGNNNLFQGGSISRDIILLGDYGNSSNNIFRDFVVGTGIVKATPATYSNYALNNTFLNVTYTANSTSTVDANSQIIRKWYYQAYVNWSTGGVVSSGNLWAKNVSGSLEFNSTISAGVIALQPITEYVNNAGTTTYYSLYNNTALASGVSSSHSFNASLGNNYSDFFTLTSLVAIPAINFTSPTPSNATKTTNNNLTVNVSLTANVSSCILSLTAPYSTQNVWIANTLDNNISKLDINGNIVGTYATGTYPSAVAVDDINGVVWVANSLSNNVTKLDWNGNTLGTYAVGANPIGVAIDKSGNIWVTNNADNTTTKLNSSGSVLATVNTGILPLGIAADSINNVWVANSGTNTITKINTTSDSVLGTYTLGYSPFGIAVDASNNVWTVLYIDNQLKQVNTAGTVLNTYSTGSVPFGVTVDSSNTPWYTNYLGNTVTKLSYLDTSVGLSPRSISSDSLGNVWVTNMDSNTTMKINSARTIVGTYNVGHTPITMGDTTGYTYRKFVLNNVGGTSNINYTMTLHNLDINSWANYTITNLDYANYSYFVQCYTSAGDSNKTETRDVEIINDSTVPLVSIVYPTNTTYTTVQTELNYTVSDANLQSCWWTNNSGSTNYSVTCGNNITTSSTQGTNVWKLYANDTAGNINSSTVTFFVDSIPPTITIVYPTNTTYDTNSFVLNITTDYADSCWYFFDYFANNNSMVQQDSTHFYKSVSSTREGDRKLTFWCNDSYGNVNSTYVDFHINTIYPVFSNFWDDNSTLLDSGQAHFNVSILNTNYTVFLQINGSNYSASNTTIHSVPFTHLTDYTVNLTLTAGIYPYQWITWGSGFPSYSFNISDTRYYTVNSSAVDAPIFSNIVSNPVNGTQFGSSFYQFNVTIISTNGTGGLDFNGVNYSLSNVSSNFFANISKKLSGGVYSYYFWAYGNGTTHTYNTSGSYSYTISKNTTNMVSLYIDNLRANYSVIGTALLKNRNVNSTLGENQSGIIEIKMAGNIISNGSAPRYNLTNLTANSNITALFYGNSNYTQASETWYITSAASPSSGGGSTDSPTPSKNITTEPSSVIVTEVSGIFSFLGDFVAPEHKEVGVGVIILILGILIFLYTKNKRRSR